MEIIKEFLQSALDSLKQEFFSSLHAVMPAQIQDYDAEKGLATVQPALRQKTSSGQILTMPVLKDVPVFLTSADHAVSPGDFCLLLFCDFCLDGWLETRQPIVPPSPRRHDLSDAIALAGFFPALSSNP